MKKIFTVLLCGTALFASSCASIVSKTRYPITIASAPEGATFSVIDRNGREVASGQTPFSVVLKTSSAFFKKAIYTIKFTKPGFDEKSLTLEADVNGWYFGNLVFGGVIGFLIVDPATGAMYKFSQKDVTAQLSQSTAFAPSDNKALKIVSLEEIPVEMRDKLERIK